MKVPDSFQQAFVHAADALSLPEEIRAPFCGVLYLNMNSPRAMAKESENWLAPLNIVWPDGMRLVQEFQLKKGTFKQLAAAFSGWVLSRYYAIEHAARIRRTARVIPYVMVTQGPVVKPCPLHAEIQNRVLLIDESWPVIESMHASVFCRCLLRHLSRTAAQRCTHNSDTAG